MNSNSWITNKGRVMMATGTAYARHEGQRLSRFSDEMFSAPWPQNPEPKPVQNHPHPQLCPYCDQPLPHARSSIMSVFVGGVRRLAVAICMIIGALLRCVRLAVACCLCLIGLIGTCCRSLGVRIAHRDDRRFFAKPRGRENVMMR